MPVHGRYRLPDFLGVGPGRTGSSWLHEVIKFRADMPANAKEVHFFSRYYGKGIDWYAWHFRNAHGDRPVGEICPYFARPECRQRVKLHLPDCKIICTLRDPVDRLYSHYKLMRHDVRTRAPFMEMFNKGPEIGNPNKYATHLTEWFRLFGRDRVLVLFYFELRENPQRYVDRVCDFIGAQRIDISQIGMAGERVNAFDRAPKSYRLARRARRWRMFLRRHDFYRTLNFFHDAGVWDFCGGRGEKFPPLTPEEDAVVRQWFLPDVEALEKLLGCDLIRWKTPRKAEKKQRDGADAGAPGNAPETASA